MSDEPEGLRLTLHAVRCVYDPEGHPRTNKAPQGACKGCLKAYPVPGADEPGAWLVRPFYQTAQGRVLEAGSPRWVCHLCLSMWDDGINAQGVYDL